MMRVGAAVMASVLLLVASSRAAAQGRGTQLSRDEFRVLVNKDVGVDRYAITQNEDGSATGNVFRSDGGPPAFLFCDPAAGPNAFRCFGADACNAEGVQRGIQVTPDGQRILVNKDVGADRWAITLNADGTVLGNVFRSGGGPPAFLSCDPVPDSSQLACFGADDCSTDRCVDQYAFIANVELPATFFEPPDPCGADFGFVADVTLPPGFFVPSRPTLEFRVLSSVTIPPNETAPFETSVDATTNSLMLQFDSGRSRIAPIDFAFPSGPVDLDYTGEVPPESSTPAYRVGLVTTPESVVPVPNSPIMPLEAGTYRLSLGNIGVAPADVEATALLMRRSDLDHGVLDVRMYFVGIDGMDAESAVDDPTANAIFDELDRRFGNAGIQVGKITLIDYPADRAPALTVIDLDRDDDNNGVADQAEEIFSLPRPMGQRTLDLFLVSDIVGSSGNVIGFSGAIPGPALAPASVQSGVVAALFNDVDMGDRQNVAALAQTIAHEAGHYLGLYHTTELDGSAGDPLLDTPFCDTIKSGPIESCPDVGDLMFPQLVDFDQSDLTADQAFVLQRHPLVRDE